MAAGSGKPEQPEDFFVIQREIPKASSINRTLRIHPDHYEKVIEISEATGVSFNKVVTQCLEYALKRVRYPGNGQAEKEKEQPAG